MSKEISIDIETFKLYFEFVPKVKQLREFSNKHVDLLQAFYAYRGEAGSEVTDNIGKLTKQIEVLADNYERLAYDLCTIINNFIQVDKEQANKITAESDNYYEEG